MSKFKVGDFVKVVSNGGTYSTYKDKFTELGFINTQLNKGFDDGTIAQIFGITKHEVHGSVLLAIVAEDGSECLINEGSVEPLVWKKKSVRVELNDAYTAVVDKDKIVVGCQTISKEAFSELLAATKTMGW